MEWLWAAFGALWTWAVAAFSLHWWRAPGRWKRDGQLSNGLGTTIIIDESRAGVRLLLFATRVLAVIGFLMAAGGAAMTIGWIWKAI